LAFPGAPLIGILLHSLALATAGAVVLLMVRRAKASTFTAALVNALVVTLVMTAIITVIDYSYLVIGLEI
jgi:predicted neutral ceramidase superfamily lipid hydrolase